MKEANKQFSQYLVAALVGTGALLYFSWNSVGKLLYPADHIDTLPLEKVLGVVGPLSILVMISLIWLRNEKLFVLRWVIWGSLLFANFILVLVILDQFFNSFPILG